MRTNTSKMSKGEVLKLDNLSRVRINRLQNALNGLVLHLGRLLSKLKRPYANHILPRCRLEPQLDLPLSLRLPGYLKNTQRKHKTPISKNHIQGNIPHSKLGKNKRIKKPESDRMRDLGVVYETVAWPGIGWQLAGTGVLQALDDGLRKMRMAVRWEYQQQQQQHHHHRHQQQQHINNNNSIIIIINIINNNNKLVENAWIPFCRRRWGRRWG